MMINSSNFITGTSARKSRIFFSILLCLFVLGSSSCNFQKRGEKKWTFKGGKENYSTYDLKNPDKIYHLPGYLREISGISSYDKNKIACIQDEKAVIYFFDTEKEKVTSKYDFGEDNDFEDVSIVGDDAFALRSDGTLFEIGSFEKNQENTIKINTSLDKKNNTEGLAFDMESNSLLIVCKDSPSINGNDLYKGFKAIYLFNLKNNKLNDKPEYLIDISKVNSMRSNGSIERFFIEIARKLRLIDDENSFQPSGIAICPVEKENIYIISGVEKLLIIMNRHGQILEVIKLDSRIFNQPEGICFSKNGDLFISNEGENGNILQFKRSTISVNQKK